VCGLHQLRREVGSTTGSILGPSIRVVSGRLCMFSLEGTETSSGRKAGERRRKSGRRPWLALCSRSLRGRVRSARFVADHREPSITGLVVWLGRKRWRARHGR
jgi:hypothetical protein